jgi:hypothetical protein
MRRAGVLARAGAFAAVAGCAGGGPPAFDEGGRALGVAGAHEHAVARVDVAVEGTVAHVAWMAPAMGVWGFEHEPRSEAERAARQAGFERLRARIGEMLVFDAAAGCVIEPGEMHAVEADHGHGHGPGHAHGGPGDHEHGAAARDAVAGEHGEVHAEFVVRCARPLSGTMLRIAVASVFPEFRDVDLQVLSDGRQLGQRVSAVDGRVRL